jgi:hypothetical protein
LSALVNYRKTGRITFAAWAWYNFASNVSERNVAGTTLWGLAAAEATVGVFYPDPVATAVGYAMTRTAVGLRSAWWRLGTAFWAMPIAQRSLATYLVVLPFAIASRQQQKMEAGDVGIDEALGQAMWKAQSIPETERLNIPSIPTSRVF